MLRRFALLLCSLTLVLSAPVQAVGTSASAAVLMDAESGRILYAHRAQERMLIASTTKIMTALVALEQGQLEAEYTVGEEDMAEGSSMYLAVGETVTLEELLYGLMLASGNDAALAVAHCVSGSVERFVAEMNRKAEELGLENTSFANPNGLDAEDHYSSAEDLAKLTAYALNSEAFVRIVSTRSITIGERTLTNHNKLLASYDGCIGVKTGYTQAAGRTLVSAARRNGQTLIVVTLRDGHDWQDHKNLLDYGFSSFPRTACLSAGQPLGEAVVRLGKQPTAVLTAAQEISYPLAEGEKPTISLTFYPVLTAPLPAGTVVGEAVMRLNGEEIGRTEILCGEDLAMEMRRPAG